jgi:acetyl-CoA C-acetyltransferase
MTDVVIVSAVRTAVGKFRGSLKDVNTADLGSTVARAALERVGVAGGEIDEVVMSETYRADLPGCSARPVALRAGVPIEVPASNLNMHCGTGLAALVRAAQSIRSGDSETALVIAMESMSRAAFLVRGIRNGFPLGHATLVDQLVQKGDPAKDPAVDPTAALSMGETAEELASRHRITRREQDEYAVQSQQRAAQALREGRFASQIVPVLVPGGKQGPVPFAVDEHPRPDTTVDSLARLKPVFRPDGTVTAGNSSGMNDGAAALLVMSAARAKARGLEPLARLCGHAAVGVPPEIMGIGPVPATRKLLQRTGYSMKDFRTIELNEAFASQVLACFRLDPDLASRADVINANGSGISLGHPIGATGAILAVKAIHELRRLGGGLGLLTMCVGGGQGIAVVIEAA